MGWLKIDSDIYSHPNTKKLANALEFKDVNVVGDYLIRFFCWSKRFCESGYVKKHEPCFIDQEIWWPGNGNPSFVQALYNTGWIYPEGWIKDWPEWGGAEVWNKYIKNSVQYSKLKPMFDFYTSVSKSEPVKSQQSAPVASLGAPRREEIEEMRRDEKRREENKGVSEQTPVAVLTSAYSQRAPVRWRSIGTRTRAADTFEILLKSVPLETVLKAIKNAQEECQPWDIENALKKGGSNGKPKATLGGDLSGKDWTAGIEGFGPRKSLSNH